MPSIKIIQRNNFQWIDIHCNNGSKNKGIKYLEENFSFHPLDIEDCISITHRAKCDQYQLYSFLIFLFPTYTEKNREITTSEIDFFVSKDYLVNVHRDRNLKIFSNFFKLCEENENEKEKFLSLPPERLLYEILNRLYQDCFPMLDHISADIDNIEKQIFAGYEKEMVHEISIIRRNITDFRKIMQPHKNVIKKLTLSLQESSLFEIQKTDAYFNNLLDYTKEIWDALENYKERIEALQETNESLISFKLNDIMKTLTIISVTTFPITLIAAIFGMNTPGIPFTELKYGFWIVFSIMLSIAFFMLMHFKKRDWM
ncbi:MAG: magnesium transporter CorA family protein [bacterium]